MAFAFSIILLENGCVRVRKGDYLIECKSTLSHVARIPEIPIPICAGKGAKLFCILYTHSEEVS
jgi:hypothetical protein